MMTEFELLQHRANAIETERRFSSTSADAGAATSARHRFRFVYTDNSCQIVTARNWPEALMRFRFVFTADVRSIELLEGKT